MYAYSLNIASILVTGAGQAVVTDLNEAGYGVDRECLLVPGAIAWDNCDCGQLAQTITGVVPSNNFPAPAADTPQTPCGPNLIVINVLLSLVRCVHVSNDNSDPPKCASLLGDAVQIERDRFIARGALRCYLKDLYDRNLLVGFVIGSATTVGPEGACAGIEIPYSLGLVNSGCC